MCAGPTDPAVQYGAYADFSFTNGLISKTLQSSINTVCMTGVVQLLGLVPLVQTINVVLGVSLQIYPLCSFGINACNSLKWDFVCSIALIICQVFWLKFLLLACVMAMIFLQNAKAHSSIAGTGPCRQSYPGGRREFQCVRHPQAMHW